MIVAMTTIPPSARRSKISIACLRRGAELRFTISARRSCVGAAAERCAQRNVSRDAASARERKSRVFFSEFAVQSRLISPWEPRRTTPIQEGGLSSIVRRATWRDEGHIKPISQQLPTMFSRLAIEDRGLSEARSFAARDNRGDAE